MSWDDRYDRFEKRPARTGLKWSLAIIGILVLLSIILGLIGLGAGWFNTAKNVVSGQHVSEVYGQVTKNWEALTVTADNACLAQGGSTADPNSPTLVESPVMAYAATYRNVRAKYNAAWENVFDAGLVGPSGYPKSIPNWTEATGPKPDFCSVSTKLEALRG